MRKFIVGICILLVSLAAIGGVLVVNRHLPFGKFSNWSQGTVEAREKQINQELASLKDHSWAGSYYYGDGLGVNVHLSLAPKSGFAFTWHGCLGLYDLNYGRVVEKGDGIKLLFTFPNERKGFEGIAPDLVPIVWGERHYLVPAGASIDFANAINAGFEPRKSPTGRFLLREGDELKPARGRPNIPATYSGYLLSRPIKAQVSSIKGSRTEQSAKITIVELNVGSAHGVKTGMEFYVYSPAKSFEWARVISVGNSSSEAEISQDDYDQKYGLPSTSWKLSTSAQRE